LHDPPLPIPVAVTVPTILHEQASPAASTSLLAGKKALYFIPSKKGFTSCIIKVGESGSSLRLRSTKRTLK
jgi:hypothetical protein